MTKAVTSALLTFAGDLICQVNYLVPVIEIIIRRNECPGISTEAILLFFRFLADK